MTGTQPNDAHVRGSARRVACVTLDFEADYSTSHFLCLNHTSDLAEVCTSLDVPLTVFVEGRVLRDHAGLLRQFPARTEFGLHCDNHTTIPDNAQALRRGKAAFEAVFGHSPVGYRAANYLMTPELYKALADEGFTYDASYAHGITALHPSDHPAEHPFRLANGLWEVPVTTWTGTRLRTSMSMVSLLSRPLIEGWMGWRGWPELFIFVVHMHDLYPEVSLKSATLKRQLGHLWNYRFGLRDPLMRFRRFITTLQSAGFDFRTVSSLIPET